MAGYAATRAPAATRWDRSRGLRFPRRRGARSSESARRVTAGASLGFDERAGGGRLIALWIVGEVGARGGDAELVSLDARGDLDRQRECAFARRAGAVAGTGQQLQ